MTAQRNGRRSLFELRPLFGHCSGQGLQPIHRQLEIGLELGKLLITVGDDLQCGITFRFDVAKITARLGEWRPETPNLGRCHRAPPTLAPTCPYR